MGEVWDADGRPRYRIDDQGSYSRRRGDEPRSGRRWRSLCGDRDFGIVPRQSPGSAAPDRLSVAERADGRRASRAGATDRDTGKLTGGRRNRGRHGGGPGTRPIVSPGYAEPAQPRYLRRTVFRPGVRFRGHADFAYPAWPVHAAWGAANHLAASERVVGVGLHLLGHKLAQS